MERCSCHPRNAGAHKKLEEAKKGFSPRASRESGALPTPRFQADGTNLGLLASGNVKEYISVVLTHPVSGPLLRQPQEMDAPIISMNPRSTLRGNKIQLLNMCHDSPMRPHFTEENAMAQSRVVFPGSHIWHLVEFDHRVLAPSLILWATLRSLFCSTAGVLSTEHLVTALPLHYSQWAPLGSPRDQMGQTT